MRNLGCLVVALVVLGVALFFADQALTTTAENRTARAVANALDAETTVDFDGWPVAARMLLGSIPTARINAIDVPLDKGGSLDRLDVEMTDVDVDVNTLRGGGSKGRLPPARSATFTAEVNEDSVAGILGLPEGVANVTLQDGAAIISAAGIKVEADVTARDGDVVVRLGGALAQLLGGGEYPIDLSTEPGAPAAEDVKIADGVLTVTGVLEDV